MMIDGQNFFDQPVKNDTRAYDNIQKRATDNREIYTSGCLLDYPYVKENYKLIAIVLSKQQALDADPKATQQIYFTGNLEPAGNVNIFFIIEKIKKNVLDFTQGTVKALQCHSTHLFSINMK